MAGRVEIGYEFERPASQGIFDDDDELKLVAKLREVRDEARRAHRDQIGCLIGGFLVYFDIRSPLGRFSDIINNSKSFCA